MNVSKEKSDEGYEYIIRANEEEILFLYYVSQHVPCNVCSEALGIDQRECSDSICDSISEKMWNILRNS